VTTRPDAVYRVLALVAKTRGLGEATRQLAADLDIPGVPERFAEQAADAAGHLERLAAKLDDYFHTGKAAR